MAVNWSENGFGGRLWKAQKGRCCYCERPMRMIPSNGKPHGPQPPDMATIEHLQPKSHGGTGGLHNIALACQSCNVERNTTPWPVFKSYKLGEHL